MLKEKMNNILITELIETDINSFLNDINSILEEKEKESGLKNITEEMEKENGCLFKHFSIGYKKFSETINKYNIYWIPTLKRFCYCSLTVPTVKENIKEEKAKTEIKETDKNIFIEDKEYNIKQFSVRLDETLKNKLDEFCKKYKYIDKTYIYSRVIELGLDSLK